MKDGGPAFPFHTEPIEGQYNAFHYPGMSLRDYFAAAALQGMLAGGTKLSIGNTLGRDQAWVAYSIADSMLAAREQEKP